MQQVNHAVAILALFISSCGGGSSTSPELEQAAGMVEYLLKPGILSQSTFPVVLPNGTPRQFVSWMFSTLGTAEWPPTERMAEIEFGDPEAAAMAGIPLRPDGVSYVHSRPDTALGKQIVVKWEDSRGVVIVEGYLDPAQPPALVKEFSLPKVQAANDLTRITAQGHLETGGTYQAF
ncbi:MAG: hypothetical protein HYW57_00710 [Ignavibacteriales bacterium]|nr:hypothetical protein [Ignavibacteriales bacterium]